MTTIEIKKDEGKFAIELYREWELSKDDDTYTVVEPMTTEVVYRGGFDGMVDFLINRLREDRIPMAKRGFVFTDKGEWASPDRISEVEGNIIPLERYLELCKEVWKEKIKTILTERKQFTLRWTVV